MGVDSSVDMGVGPFAYFRWILRPQLDGKSALLRLLLQNRCWSCLCKRSYQGTQTQAYAMDADNAI